MTPREYLEQAYWLDHWIKSDLMEIEQMRELSQTVSSPGFGEPLFTQRNTDARFVRILARMADYETKICAELDLLTKLKEESREVIMTVENTDERVILMGRYLDHLRWREIGDMIGASERTVRRWHEDALEHVVMPENPIVIGVSE